MQGPKPEETTAASSGGSGSVTDSKLSGKTSSAPGVSTDKLRNYGVLAFTVTALSALGWYTLSKDQETEAVVQKWGKFLSSLWDVGNNMNACEKQ